MNNFKYKTMGNNLTEEENIILNLLLSKKGAVSEIVINDRKETQKEMQIRVSKNFTEYMVKIAIKKNRNK